ncbi:MAG: CDP-diacylglycerol--glycerol-3-phosphate 3-phosphatidyltransferase, partial [Solirubrobacterales bacterium]|nr:CDP-diacylglycerol--glycerol-3-phosphate 3-phosphatidyltransferase [Solirubrobacterales bacterium]
DLDAGALRTASTRGSARASALILAGTSIRIVVTPVVMGLILGHSWTAAAIVFLAVSSTDWFDGRLARRWNVSSRLGSFLDTTADKLLVTGVLIALVATGRASPWLSLAIIGRELIVLGLRAAVAAQGLHLEASMLGKWKATAQFVALTLIMLRPEVTFAGAYLDQWLLGVAALVTVWSGVDYFVRFSSALRADG